MARSHLEETADLVIWGEDGGIPGALDTIRAHATALRASCPRDVQRLASLFDATERFGTAQNKINVVLDPTLSLLGVAVGQNDGFKQGGQTEITLGTAGQLFSGYSAAEVDDAIAAAFAAELAEVLLSLRGLDGHTTLDRGQCDGEGFSRVMAAWLHPVGYYRVIGRATYQGLGPDYPAVIWMNEPGATHRYDYLGSTDYGDGVAPANGCAILFLHYLHSQLGYPWRAIVDALGATLPETFSNLTGPGDGFADMRELLSRVFPTAVNVAWQFENPFPVGDRQRWQVTWSTPDSPPSDGPQFQDDILAEGDIDVRPSPLCPAGNYHYSIALTHSAAAVTAYATGLGQPVFEWAVAGQADEAAPVKVTAYGWSDDPSTPWAHTPASGETTLAFEHLDAAMTWEGPASSTLTVSARDKPPVIPGHFSVPVTLSIRDATLSDAAMVWDTAVFFDLERLTWDPRFGHDRDACTERWRNLLVKFELYRDINILRTLPDPPPELERARELIDSVRRELEMLQNRAPEAAKQAEDALRALGWPTSSRQFEEA